MTLPFLCESNFLGPAQRFHRKFQAGCGRSAFRSREGNQFGGPVGADIRGSLSCIVNLEPPLNVVCDPGVEATVRAPEHVNEPQLGQRL